MKNTDAYPIPTLSLLPLRERPAYRVAQGAGDCNLAELLAAAIGGPRQIEIAHALLAEFGDLPSLARASARQIEAAVHGLGPAGAARLKAALELGRRLLADDDPRPQIRKPEDVARLLMPEMALLEQEHLRVILLNTRNYVLDIPTIYIGSANTTLVRPAEVLRPAIAAGAVAIIVVPPALRCAQRGARDNHPSSDPTPSPEDQAATKKIVHAGQLLDIEVLDHVILGRNRWVSLKERGLGFS